MTRLKRSNCGAPGITRRRRGKGFEYLDEAGTRITEPDVLERIGELSIPPAWDDVWVCPYPMGHIQATGVDAAGRKQYLYHQRWRELQDLKKFNSMVDFAKALPALRKRVARDLRGEGLTERRVLAAAVRLLDRGFLRIGGESYAEDNDSYGLATMRKDHVTVDSNSAIKFDFTGKSGIRHVRYVVDEQVAEIVRRLKRRRGGGEELLAYKDESSGRWRDVRSPEIRAYVKEAAGDDYTAKDFRTWAGTVLAAMTLATTEPERRKVESANKRMIALAVKQVAYFLGNTPAVARASYIDPRVLDRFRDGYTIEPVLIDLDEPDIGQPGIQGRVEEAVLDLIDEPRGSDLVEKAA
jgi:DNA topoisomerase IB